MIAAAPPPAAQAQPPRSMLPPTPRDFEIHRAILVEHMSTRNVADRYRLSQTRVRQLVHRVTQWLAGRLPAGSELEIEQEARLAQHLAAAQLQHQCEQLRAYWDGTSDPKYLRQQTRVVLALARLGVVPGAIEALAADAADEVPASANAEAGPSTVHRSAAERTDESAKPTLDLGSWTSDTAAESPPVGACSASSDERADEDVTCTTDFDATSDGVSTFVESQAFQQSQLQGLAIMEDRLLTLIQSTPPEDGERLSSLQSTLTKVRGVKAELEVKLSPAHPGVAIAILPADSIVAVSPSTADVCPPTTAPAKLEYTASAMTNDQCRMSHDTSAPSDL